MNNNKHYFNFESITIKGNIGSDIILKTSTKERIEFLVAVNKYNKQTDTKTAKWFKVIVFYEEIISSIKDNKEYKKGSNVEIQGEIKAEIYKDKPLLKIIARKVSLNTKES
jgi:single-stranded DNA-binding protein